MGSDIASERARARASTSFARTGRRRRRRGRSVENAWKPRMIFFGIPHANGTNWRRMREVVFLRAVAQHRDKRRPDATNRITDSPRRSRTSSHYRLTNNMRETLNHVTKGWRWRVAVNGAARRTGFQFVLIATWILKASPPARARGQACSAAAECVCTTHCTLNSRAAQFFFSPCDV